MPLKRCQVNGVPGWKYGDEGKCYTGPGAKDKATVQALAIGGGSLPKDFVGGRRMKNKKGSNDNGGTLVNFAGFDDWVEVFAGGKQTDSYGREWDGDKLVDKAVATFNAEDYEPPAVIGHPQENAPAYGWVEGVRQKVRDGKKVLEAKFKQVVPEFAQMVEQGLFKKRSASFYPDGRLRHVGYLGAAPPAVKGLTDIAFKDQGDVVNFEEDINRRNDMKNNDKASILQALLKVGRTDVAELLKGSQFNEGDVGGDNNGNTNALDMDSLADALIKKLGLQQNYQGNEGGGDGASGTSGTSVAPSDGSPTPAFNEAQIREDERRKAEGRMMKEITQIKTEARSKELESLINDKIRDGVIPPAFKEHGLKEFLTAIDNIEQPIEFTDGAMVKKEDPVSLFMGFMEKASTDKLFSEYASFSTSANEGQNDKDDALGDKIASLSPLYEGRQGKH